MARRRRRTCRASEPAWLVSGPPATYASLAGSRLTASPPARRVLCSGSSAPRPRTCRAPATWRPSSWSTARSTHAPTSTRSASRCTNCWPCGRRSTTRATNGCASRSCTAAPRRCANRTPTCRATSRPSSLSPATATRRAATPPPRRWPPTSNASCSTARSPPGRSGRGCAPCAGRSATRRWRPPPACCCSACWRRQHSCSGRARRRCTSRRATSTPRSPACAG